MLPILDRIGHAFIVCEPSFYNVLGPYGSKRSMG